ncbi:uncharacterized protein H6S33_007107 [Morchella sextelata]|uniref:uncharacterized protein n=1 Tax=Morchella sextelata TaxID=1174677 RepID=UPI001D054308|nr:uncharacterized protein H6S33_007107 [Morchella sextelata]KAH0604076.1 hypothetical protein H6S33_007107 [Morchella sextelata]
MTTPTPTPTPTPCPVAPSVPAPTDDSEAEPTSRTPQATVAGRILLFAALTSIFQEVLYFLGYVPLCRSFPWTGVSVVSAVLLALVEMVDGGWLPFLSLFAAFCVYVYFAVGPGARRGVIVAWPWC